MPTFLLPGFRTTRWLLTLCATCGVGWAPLSIAMADNQLQIDAIEGKDWSARGVVVGVSLTREGWAATVQIDTAALPGQLGTASKLEVRCPELQLSATQVRCKAALVKGNFDTLGYQNLSGPFSYDRDKGELRFSLRGIGMAAKQLKLETQWRDGQWTAAIDVQHADSAKLATVASFLAPASKQFTMQGALSLQAQLSGAAAQLSTMQGSLALERFTLNNTDGSIATDKLNLAISGQAQRTRAGWQFDFAPASSAGQGYVEPLFLDFSAYPLRAHVHGLWSETELRLDNFTVTHAKSFRGNGSANFNLRGAPKLRQLDVTIDELNFPGAFINYLQPLLVNTSFKSLQTAGSLHGQLKLRDGRPTQLDATLEGVDLDDGSTLALAQLQGSVHWAGDQTHQAAQPSMLSWRDGSLFGLELGAAQLHFSTVGNGIRLDQSAHIPVFEGAIDIDRLSAQGLGTDDLAFSLDANVLPIGVDDISRAFHWPVFGGTLSGRLTGLEMKSGVVSLATTLNAHVFDGRVSISHLRLEDFFGRFPRLHSDIRIDNLDLEQVTSAFSFGRITGRLSGEILELDLFDWMPVSFDAHLETPAGDRSKHLISQRAVANIGSLGGSGAGVSAALSSGFLRFFDDFNYERIGIGCRVKNDVCHMHGVAPARTGYYLVKGSGIPRIDVIGNSDRVDWPRLVAQLKAISESSGPVVK